MATLLLSAAGFVHEESCQTMRHVIAGMAARYHGEDLERVTFEYVAVDPDELIARKTRYRRCSHCSPDIQPYVKTDRRVTSKSVANLGSADVGRESEYGFIECIEHGKERTVIALAGGTLQYLHPDERIGLYAKERIYVRGV